MAKRIADKELTDRNWDQEDEGEEAGTFSVASDDVLKGRAIKKAKRRNTGGEGEGGGAFRGFKGFSLTTVAASPACFSGFGNAGGFKGFGGLINGTSSASSFGGFSSPATSTAAAGLTFNGPSSTPSPGAVGPQQTNGSAPCPPASHREYRRQLTALNCSVRDWISKHVDDNPLCDLNPIFKDYERHLASIERQYGAGATDGVSEEKKPPTASPPSTAPAAALFSFGKKPTEGSAQKGSGVAPPTAGVAPPTAGVAPPTAGVTFNFGEKVDSSVLGSLGSKPASFSSKTPLFGFPGSTTPLSFSGSKPEAAHSADENGDEESEEPPKPEVKEVKEDDAFYSQKCKLFYKKEAEFKEKGVGTLHLKHTADGKTQMVVRADTNLGNILLNIIVPPSMPCSRVGKNNVMVVCVPNPPVDKNPGSPIPLLIRVKTSEDADELHRTLEQKKG